MREWTRDIGLRLAPPLGVGLLLGLIGPFGTYDRLPLFPRLGYWLAVVSLNWVLADAGIRRVDALAGHRLRAARFSVPILGALIVSVPATGVVVLANGLSGIGWPSSVAVLYAQVLILLAAISLPVYQWQEIQEAASAARADGDDSRLSANPAGADARGLALFLARLSGPLKGRLLCIETQDHYLAVHTTGGTEMILCRMEDAARELGGIGRRVHRSWWVAEDAVEATVRDGQRQFLRLVDGRSVPVGRSYRPDLKQAGWLKAR
ncbi:LytTR family transcriptional regulator [Rhodobacteraceae bacterium 2376]|uniref:LytTR family transcriptional regulator n=1 Tax=Rhabdonatronobacter sediminivivens TaxID=2743469 RepID=A0A7Z0L2I5_9RHOB|nr:LytTR family DNA-binding domain-containing protein [Rhabdonatronobacter sediminivivens]NYS26483.1 LytTR family transcriptional regulator [Rhabdonatronobacter sediminivivens]